MKLRTKGLSTFTTIAALAIVAVLTAGIVYFAVSSTSQTTQTSTTTITSTVIQSTTTTATRTYKMALVLGGDETDAGWSAVAIQASNVIHEKYGWSVDISRDVAFPDQARVLTDYAQRGYDLIWTHGGQFIGDTFTVANNFNNTFFAQVPGPANFAPPNVVSLGPSFQVTGFYKAGVLAGKMTKTNSLGMVFGQWFDYLSMEGYAFIAGVHSSNPNAKVYVRVVGTWGDPSLGFQIASSLIQTKNVDIIVQIADATGRGVITAAQQYNATVIGTVGDQAVLAPYNTLTSVMMNTTGYMETVVKHVMAGDFKQALGGKVINVNIGYLAPFHNYDSKVPQSVKDLLVATEQGMQNGSIAVPQTVTQDPPPDP